MRQIDLALIPNTPRGGPSIPFTPQYAYALTAQDRRRLLKDPACKRAIFEAALEELDSLRHYEPDERCVITQEKLIEAGLEHQLREVEEEETEEARKEDARPAEAGSPAPVQSRLS